MDAGSRQEAEFAGRDAGMDVGSRNVGRDPCGELGRAGSQKAGQFSGAAFQTWLFLLFFFLLKLLPCAKLLKLLR